MQLAIFNQPNQLIPFCHQCHVKKKDVYNISETILRDSLSDTFEKQEAFAKVYLFDQFCAEKNVNLIDFAQVSMFL